MFMSTTVLHAPASGDNAPARLHLTADTTSKTTSYVSAETEPLISVIVPVHNTGAFLVDAVKSVVAQTYPHLELILVDDASSDELTLKLLAAYEQVDVLTPDNFAQVIVGIELPSLAVVGKQPQEIVAVNEALKQRVSMNTATAAKTQVQIRVMHAATNQGAGGCRNMGIRASKGVYLLFLDADDLFAPQLIEHVYKAKMRSGAEIVFFSNHNFSYDPDCDLSLETHRVDLTADKLLSHEEIIKEHRLYTASYTAWGGLFKRQVLLEHKLFFASQVIFEDADWVVRLLLNTKSIYYTPFDGYWRLLHASQSTVVGARGARAVEAGDMVQRMAQDIKGSPYYDQARNSCIEMAIGLVGYLARKIKGDTPNKKQILQELFSRVASALEMLDAPVSRNPSWIYMQWHHLGYKLPWLSANARSNHRAAAHMAHHYLRYCK